MEQITLRGPEGDVYFTRRELACKSTGKLALADGFAENLIRLRYMFDQPMIITSCCRSTAHNQSVGGSRKSFHIYDNPPWSNGGACAVDIRTPDGRYAKELVALALELGWSAGVGRRFIHLDRRSDYTNMAQTLFGYG